MGHFACGEDTQHPARAKIPVTATGYNEVALKFVVASFCKVPKSLDVLDISALPTVQKIISSKTFSKKFANLKTK